MSTSDRFFHSSKRTRNVVNTSQLHIDLVTNSRSKSRKYYRSRQKHLNTNRMFQMANFSSTSSEFTQIKKQSSATMNYTKKMSTSRSNQANHFISNRQNDNISFIPPIIFPNNKQQKPNYFQRSMCERWSATNNAKNNWVGQTHKNNQNLFVHLNDDNINQAIKQVDHTASYHQNQLGKKMFMVSQYRQNKQIRKRIQANAKRSCNYYIGNEQPQIQSQQKIETQIQKAHGLAYLLEKRRNQRMEQDIKKQKGKHKQNYDFDRNTKNKPQIQSQTKKKDKNKKQFLSSNIIDEEIKQQTNQKKKQYLSSNIIEQIEQVNQKEEDNKINQVENKREQFSDSDEILNDLLKNVKNKEQSGFDELITQQNNNIEPPYTTNTFITAENQIPKNNKNNKEKDRDRDEDKGSSKQKQVYPLQSSTKQKEKREKQHQVIIQKRNNNHKQLPKKKQEITNDITDNNQEPKNKEKSNNFWNNTEASLFDEYIKTSEINKQQKQKINKNANKNNINAITKTNNNKEMNNKPIDKTQKERKKLDQQNKEKRLKTQQAYSYDDQSLDQIEIGINNNELNQKQKKFPSKTTKLEPKNTKKEAQQNKQTKIQQKNTKNEIQTIKQAQNKKKQKNNNVQQKALIGQQFASQLQEILYNIYLIGQFYRDTKKFHELLNNPDQNSYKVLNYYILQHRYNVGEKTCYNLLNKENNIYQLAIESLKDPRNQSIIEESQEQLQEQNQEVKKKLRKIYDGAKQFMDKKQRIFTVDWKNSNHSEKCEKLVLKQFKQIQLKYKQALKLNLSESKITLFQNRLCELIEFYSILRIVNGHPPLKDYDTLEDIANKQTHYQQYKHLFAG